MPDASLGYADRKARYLLLREATARPAPPVITEAGLGLLLEPDAPDDRPDREELARAGLLGPDGRLNPAAKDVADAVRRPSVQLAIEVAAGQSVRALKAWLGFRRAVILAQPSPAIMAANSPHDVAERAPLTLAEYALDVVVPGWVPVAAVRWLGFGPRESPVGNCRLPLPVLLRRVADAGVPVPADDPVLAGLWGEPLQLCAISVQPSGERVLLLDAARTGLWLLSPDEGDPEPTAVLTPLPSHAVWRLLLTLITGADKARRKGPI